MGPLGSIRLISLFLWSLFFGATALFASYILNGSSSLNIVQMGIAGTQLDLSLRLDSISSLMLVMVTLLGAVIGKYAIRYLAGEPRQMYFFRYLVWIVVAVSILVLANNFVVLALAWMAMSFGLHRLLEFYPDRRRAVLATRKKQWLSRFGDATLVTGIVCCYQVFGSLNFDVVFAAANTMQVEGVYAAYLGTAGVMFALTAMAKSAQFPLHFWLPETMETPTPVSALMHAGVINSGGILLIRLSQIMQHAGLALSLLTIIGALTAVFGALVMVTQNSIKQKLAYSTVSQMGMMIFACGLGAYSIALFHLFAHSFYKAYAFLSTGVLVEENKQITVKPKPLNTIALASGTLIGLGVIVAGATQHAGQYLATATYGAVLLLGFCQAMSQTIPPGLSRGRVFAKTFAVLGIAILGYIGIETSLSQFLLHDIAGARAVSGLASGQAMIALTAYAMFAAGIWTYRYILEPKSKRVHALRSYLWNGGYFTQNSNRIFERYV